MFVILIDSEFTSKRNLSWAVMYMSFRGIEFVCFWDLSIRFWTWSDSVVLFTFHFMVKHYACNQLILLFVKFQLMVQDIALRFTKSQTAGTRDSQWKVTVLFWLYNIHVNLYNHLKINNRLWFEMNIEWKVLLDKNLHNRHHAEEKFDDIKGAIRGYNRMRIDSAMAI